MKVERLYAITLYLLNHGRTSAKELANYFEVSIRTIQRDIDSLSISGIPIIAINGATGGYEISKNYKFDKLFATIDDYSNIKTALQGLVSATDNLKVKHTLEKIVHVSNSNNNNLILDLSILRESNQVILQMLQTAALEKHAVSFCYTNNNNETRIHTVEPIAVIYRWYAWYLLAYSKIKNDYRIYKIIRMEDLKITDIPFIKDHEPADIILKKTDKIDSRKYTDILVKCKKEVKSRVIEYLNGTIIEEYANGDTLMNLTVVENEQLWIGTILSLSDNIIVISPEKIRNKIIEAASKVISLYNKPDKFTL